MTCHEVDATRVFATGDITDDPGKVRLAAVGFGDVTTAVSNAAVHLDPGAQLFGATRPTCRTPVRCRPDAVYVPHESQEETRPCPT